MDERVQKFIKEFDEKQAEKLAQMNQKKRETVLIAAGMCDKKKNKEATKISESFPYLDKADGHPYRLEAWEITDEEYNEVVKHLPEEMLNNPEQFLPENKSIPNNKAENMLNVASYILLVAGILGFVLCFILAGEPQDIWDDWFEEFNWTTFIYGIVVGIVGFTQYALMQVLRNISLKLDK